MEKKEDIKINAGLEIHQQIDSHKLFCSCPSVLRSDSAKFIVKRKLNPVAGESGKIDSAAMHEKLKDETFFYEVYDSNCLVELDEEPPHEINHEALKVALQIAILLNCKIFPVAQIMRKTVLDGSNTSGFQRTVMFAHDGFVETTFGKVGIDSVMLEEDAARTSENSEGLKIWKLDRLGIPLVEIATGPHMHSPEQIKEVALKIGEILRSCKIKRGIGTIRQDLNISTEKTERVEIKGFQEPRVMIKTVETEVERQKMLDKIFEELKKRKATGGSEEKVFDVTNIFKNSECRFVKEKIEKGEKVFAVNLCGFDKILGMEISKGKRFGTEISEHAKVYGVGGIIHSDENLKKYNFSEREVKELKNILQIKKADAFVVVVGEENKAKKALTATIKRANLQISKNSVKEVRRANEDGTSSFLRPMPGEARMYPETDLKFLKISREMLDEAKASLPKLLSENRSYLEKFGLNDELIKNLVKQNRLEDFKYLMNTTKNAQLVAKCLTIFPKEIAVRENESVEKVNFKLNLQIIEIILSEVESGKISEGDVKNVLQKIVGGLKVEEALRKEQIDLASEIKILKKEKPGLSANAYMGLIMAKFRGRVSGKEVMELLK